MAIATPLIPPPAIEIPFGEHRRVRVQAQIGRGSVATVYRGQFETALSLRRAVALKVFDPIASDERETIIDALASSARRLAAVRHPNVVRVEDFGLLAPAQPYVLQELVEGRSLLSLMAYLSERGERMPLDLALFIGIETADALAGARLACSIDGMRLGIVHGELAACDVLLSWHGEVKVSDFGMGGGVRASSTVRRARVLARRSGALAPEVMGGDVGDGRSDVFSLGVLLHEMLVGPRFPPWLSAEESVSWARRGTVHHGMFEPRLSPALRAILRRALEPDPAARYPHAGTLGYDLRHVALAMGVGDGRPFLRVMLARAFAEDDDGDVTTSSE
jgi:serine/threonine-protein kinase